MRELNFDIQHKMNVISNIQALSLKAEGFSKSFTELDKLDITELERERERLIPSYNAEVSK